MAKAVRRLLVLREGIKYLPVQRGGETVYVEECRRIHIDISGDDTFNKVALSVLMGRFGGDHKDFQLQPPAKPPDCPISRTQYFLMKPGDEGYEEATKVVQESVDARRRYTDQLRIYESTRECIEKEDERVAPAILQERRGFPGENYEIVYVYDEYP